MPVRTHIRQRTMQPRLGHRLRHEGGFTMIVAMVTMLVIGLLLAAAFIATTDDTHLDWRNTAQKQAYYAAQAGLSTYLYDLNQNGNYWSTCTNDVQAVTAVPGATAGEQYSYQPLYNPGYSAANCAANPISALVDSSTGTVNMEFFGYAGHPQQSVGIVASFRKDSPLDFLWYTVYEAQDPRLLSNLYSCSQFIRTGQRPVQCNLWWATGSVVNGPMYTEDQFLVSGSPTFGRKASDKIESVAPGSVCAAYSGCQQANFKGTPFPGAPVIAPPSDNSGLLTDAQNYGKVFTGTTNITLNGNTATVVNCPTDANSCGSPTTVDLTQYPIIYVANAPGCTPPPYTPFNTQYALTIVNGQQYAYGCTGDAYVSGNYTTSATIAAANDIVVPGNITTTTNPGGGLAGTATLGLVANDFVRMQHLLNGTRGNGFGQCSVNGGPTVTNANPNSITIDAAILALQHEFVLDNFDCGTPLGTETVNGAIAETFAAADGVMNGAGVLTNGYIDNYTYDDRLKVTLPPYLFDIATAGWHVFRENVCTPNGSVGATC